MATFNTKTDNSNIIVELHASEERQALVNAVLTNFVNEPKFYGDNTDQLIDCATELAKRDPLFVAKLAVYARTVFNMRTVSAMLACVLAHTDKGTGLSRKACRNVCLRGDDVTSLVAAYEKLYGKPFPNSLIRGCKDALENMPEYALAKYQMCGHDVEMRDVIKLCHPDASKVSRKLLFRRIIESKQPRPRTWETDIVSKGNNTKMWTDLIMSGQLPYMAMLRNLRNIVDANVAPNIYVPLIADPAHVKNSRQLPFRFYSAYKALPRYAPKAVFEALENALETSIFNMPGLEGNTLIAVDSSASMGMTLSARGKTTCEEVAALLAMTVAKRCARAMMVTFDSETRVVKAPKDPSTLKFVKNFRCAGGCTNLESVFNFLLDNAIDVDRIIVLSDNEANVATTSRWRGDPTRALDEYRRRHPDHDIWVHSWDLMGYGRQAFVGDKVNYLSGWSEKGIALIPLAERGAASLIDDIVATKLA